MGKTTIDNIFQGTLQQSTRYSANVAREATAGRLKIDKTMALPEWRNAAGRPPKKR